jgi:hypothetical protein
MSKLLFGEFFKTKFITDKTITMPIFKILLKLFQTMNMNIKAIEQCNSIFGIRLISFEKLIGLDVLWSIVVTGKLEKSVESELIKLIVVCYIYDNREKFEPNKNGSFRSEQFFHDSTSKLVSLKNNIDRIGLLVDVIIFYIQNIDGKKYLKGINPSQRKVSCRLNFTNANIPEKKVTLPENSTLNH